MATRNLSAKFLSLRAASQQLVTTKGSGAEGPARDEEAGLPLVDEEAAAAVPAWVAIHQGMVTDMNLIREKIRELQKLHTVRLRVSFGDAVIAQQEKGIDTLTNEIQAILRRSETNIKQISIVGNNGTLSSQERTTRVNVMRSLAAELQQASKQYRLCQKEFLHNLRLQEQVGEQFFSDGGGGSSSSSGAHVSLEDAMDRGLTPAQVSELALMERQASDREKEIIHIAQSVNELANLFKELNQLVIEQGTVLDRIDYNIESSLVKIKKGVIDLEDADKQSKKALTMKCIILLAIICFLLLIVFIWKHSS